MVGPESTFEPRSPVNPGDVLADKYEVERTLGIGGMGVVVAARHVHIQHRVALKFLLPESAGDGVAVARFLREAQAAMSIQSEHVARVTDVGTLAQGTPYLVMEYLDGADLARVLERRGPLPIAEAVGYLLQAMVAIAEAHALGIVHRDLKPSNLFLTERSDGAPLVKVLDFGISKSATATGPTSNLTRTSGTMGSPLYMAPEQIRSAKQVDRRADLWSLGVILQELLTGKTPFFADEVNGVLAAVVADPPTPARSLRSDIPPGLEQVILRTLEKDPKNRYANVAELARALEPFCPEGPVLVQRIVATALKKEGPASVHARTMESVTVGSAPTAVAATAGAWAQPAERKSGFRSARKLLVAAAVALAGGAALGLGTGFFGSGVEVAVAPEAGVPGNAAAAPEPAVTAALTPEVSPLPAPSASAPLPAASSATAAPKPAVVTPRPARTATVRRPSAPTQKPKRSKDVSEVIDARR
jgi:serine/threonine-protein kinase